ncbi:MAG: hypothetical protein HY791_29260 [Deltaproteobacteria bacterium]|nr:hypothetical protein [Deltaproteobacteria bacterium]
MNELRTKYATEPGCAMSRAMALMQLGVTLNKKGSIQAADEGVRLLEEALRTLGPFAGKHGSFGGVLGQIQYNLATCLGGHHHGEVASKLRRAVELLEAAESDPDRQKGKPRRLTLHQLGVTWRKISRMTSQPLEQRESFDKAREYARHTLAEPSLFASEGQAVLLVADGLERDASTDEYRRRECCTRRAASAYRSLCHAEIQPSQASRRSGTPSRARAANRGWPVRAGPREQKPRGGR